jgi:hypothetical protein
MKRRKVKYYRIVIMLVLFGILFFTLGYEFKTITTVEKIEWQTLQPAIVIEPVIEVKEDDYIVGESDEVSDDYFDDAIFIGNSRMEGFCIYSGLENVQSYTTIGLSVSSIFKDKVIRNGDKRVTIMDKLKNVEFSKVYIMLGVNELGWIYNEVFIADYLKIIKQLKKINPDCLIYVESILPLSKEISDNDKIYNNKKINEYNILIKNMCDENDLEYVNIKELFININGYLKEDVSNDGIHIKADKCKDWLKYLKTHIIS